MAKIAISSIKYSINADFEAQGRLEKPDVIGALFGQTEGLLGSDMELRELQKEGKIGRIEVALSTQEGITTGEITIPTALDKTGTTIIAAAIETIDKIGPTDAKITIQEIEDVRGSKRDYILERAKQLLSSVKGAELESLEMGQEIRESSRTARIVSYGSEKLPAGPEIDSSDEVIVVEGRADVVNVLKHNINNAIGMDGAKLPKTIAELGKTKELTLFVDGDRGGKLIAENVYANVKLAWITQAPDGKEVEELAGKEIYQALRKKVKPEVFLVGSKTNYSKAPASTKEKSTKNLSDDEKKKLSELSDEIKGRNVLVLDEDLNIIRNIPASKLAYLNTNEKVFVLMTKTTSRALIEGAEKLGARYIAAEKFSAADTRADVEFVSV